MKILYISSDHGQLEFLDLQMLNELGIEWFSTGLYVDPHNPNTEHCKREPFLNITPNLDRIEKFRKLNPNRQLNTRVLVSKELVDEFDVVWVSHCCPWPFNLVENWENIKHKPVFWRTYCQQQTFVEQMHYPLFKAGMKVVRASPKEQTIPGALPATAILRGFIDEKEYSNWNGNDLSVLTFNNFYARRDEVSNTSLYRTFIRSTFQCKLYGGYNDNHPDVLGYLNWVQQKEAYRNARVYFALGSKPAAVTFNFVEALMTGTPVVTWGKSLGSLKGHPEWSNTYELPDLITNGVNGLCSDNFTELQDFIRTLLTDFEYASYISKNGRELALREFSKEKITLKWKSFLESL